MIPVRNRQAALDRLLHNIDGDVGCNRDRVELIIVDDASDPPVTLPTLAYLRPALVRLPVRQGANPARAIGFQMSTGRAVHFHDSDDGVVPGWVGAVMGALAAQPAADILLTRRLDEFDGRHVPARQRYFERFPTVPSRLRRMLMLRNCLGPLGGVIFRRRLLDRLPFPDQPSAQDWALYAEIYARWQPKGLAVPEARFIYRRDGADRISSAPRRKVLGFAAIARRTRHQWYGPMLRLHHLHQARHWLAVSGGGAGRAVLRRTRVMRWVAHLLVTAYGVIVLGLR